MCGRRAARSGHAAIDRPWIGKAPRLGPHRVSHRRGRPVDSAGGGSARPPLTARACRRSHRRIRGRTSDPRSAPAVGRHRVHRVGSGARRGLPRSLLVREGGVLERRRTNHHPGHRVPGRRTDRARRGTARDVAVSSLLDLAADQRRSVALRTFRQSQRARELARDGGATRRRLRDGAIPDSIGARRPGDPGDVDRLDAAAARRRRRLDDRRPARVLFARRHSRRRHRFVDVRRAVTPADRRRVRRRVDVRRPGRVAGDGVSVCQSRHAGTSAAGNHRAGAVGPPGHLARYVADDVRLLADRGGCGGVSARHARLPGRIAPVLLQPGAQRISSAARRGWTAGCGARFGCPGRRRRADGQCPRLGSNADLLDTRRRGLRRCRDRGSKCLGHRVADACQRRALRGHRRNRPPRAAVRGGRESRRSRASANARPSSATT